MTLPWVCTDIPLRTLWPESTLRWIAEAESGRAAFFCNSMSSQPGRPRFRRKDGWLMLLVEHEEVDLILSR